MQPTTYNLQINAHYFVFTYIVLVIKGTDTMKAPGFISVGARAKALLDAAQEGKLVSRCGLE